MQLALLRPDADLAEGLPPHTMLQDVIADRWVLLGPAATLPDALTGLQGAAGILSRPFDALDEAACHHDRALSMMTVMQRLGRLTRILHEDEVSLFARLFETAKRSHVDAFVSDRLRPIEQRDPAGRAQLKTTLLSFFDNQFSATRTSAALNIHINTVRQRLATLAQVLGGWDDPLPRLDLHVALQLDALEQGREGR